METGGVNFDLGGRQQLAASRQRYPSAYSEYIRPVGTSLAQPSPEAFLRRHGINWDNAWREGVHPNELHSAEYILDFEQSPARSGTRAHAGLPVTLNSEPHTIDSYGTALI